MRYYLLRQDARRDSWSAVSVEGVSLDALRAGLPMDVPSAPVRVTVPALRLERSDYLGAPCPIVSDAMRRALDAAGVDNVQYFAAHVVAEAAEDTRLAEYWVANVVGALACAEPLPAGPVPGGPEDGGAGGDAPEPLTSGFQINPRRARDCDLFRLAEDRRLIVVSERVAERLRAADLRGLVLQAPEAYAGRRVRTAPPGGEPPAGA